jgi:DNA polymerase III alpha subunit (gram-positive type)
LGKYLFFIIIIINNSHKSFLEILYHVIYEMIDCFRYDFLHLLRLCAVHEVSFDSSHVTGFSDTLVMARKLYPEKGKKLSLVSLVEQLKVTSVGGEHNAVYDAENLRRMALAMAESPDALVQGQWYRSLEEMKEFAAKSKNKKGGGVAGDAAHVR